MELPESTDSQLLSTWLAQREETAFRALVERHGRFVHSVARRACQDDAQAADVSQLVFILLAQKAATLTSRTSIAGWLHLTTVKQAQNFMAKSRREARKLHHFKTHMETPNNSDPSTSWQEIRPQLDQALAALSESDREALLLRFHRSLSVKEIATTLGLTANTAQKRLDRATDRLREKLTRRGVTTAGSLSAVMLVGFSTDAQAAVISTSVLSSKAIAASAIPTTSLFATLLAMKTTSYIAPAVIIICGGLFLNSQSQAILKTRQETVAIRAAIPAYVSALVTNDRSTVTTAKMDWEKIARRMDADPTQAPIIEQQLLAHLKSQSREEIILALDVIQTLELKDYTREFLMELVAERLSDLDPEYVVQRFSERLCGPGRDFEVYGDAFSQWARKDPLAAQEWLDSQEANGKLAATAINGRNESRIRLEAQLLPHLLAHDPGAVTTRLARLSESQRDAVLRSVDVFSADLKSKINFTNYIRSQLSEAKSVDMIAMEARTLFIYEGGREVADAYLNLISATPAERAAAQKAIEERVASQKR